MPETGKTATPEQPEYSKFKQDDGAATEHWSIQVDEGWRSWILCSDMYEWAAEQLLDRLRASSGEWKQW